MDESTDKLLSAVLRLPPADRAKIAEALLVSLAAEHAAWQASWLVEATRRSRAADGDPSRLRPAAASLHSARERFPEEDDPARGK